MLAYFPTPYPDEIWLSVLWRYQIRIGDVNPLYSAGSFTACPGVSQVTAELPEGMMDAEEMILEHSLFCYYYRMRTIEDKIKLLAALSTDEGRAGQHTQNRQLLVLRYCPCCMKEDMEKYGESYWHREHQLPYMPVCPKHKVRLIEYRDKKPGQQKRPKLPEWIDEGKTDYRTVSAYESALADTLCQYLTLPWNVGPSFGPSLLYMDIVKKYGTIRHRSDIPQRGAMIYSDLVSAFGEDPVRAVFGNRLLPYTLEKIGVWKFMNPEPYAFLSTLMGMKPEEIFARQHAGDFERNTRQSLKTWMPA